MKRPLKVCGCGAAYADAGAWRALPLVGRIEIEDGEFAELRNCTCRSTIAVEEARLFGPSATLLRDLAAVAATDAAKVPELSDSDRAHLSDLAMTLTDRAHALDMATRKGAA